jgi:hypothetical protein
MGRKIMETKLELLLERTATVNQVKVSESVKKIK